MKKTFISMLLLLPLAAVARPTGVVDTGLHYNTIGVSYTAGEFDDFDDVDFDGFLLDGSILINQTFFIAAKLAAVESDSMLWTDGFSIFSDRLEVSDLNIGLGARLPIAANVDLTGTVGMARQRLELGGMSDSDSSLLLRAGIRAMLTPQIELGGGATYTDLFDESGFTFDLTGAAYVLEQLAIVGGVTLYEAQDATFWNVGLRLSF